MVRANAKNTALNAPNEGDGRRWGLSGSNPLNIKGAEKPFEEAWVDRLNGLKDHEGPIALLGPEGQLWRLWPRVEKEKTEARHWRHFVRGVTNAMTPPPPRKRGERLLITGNAAGVGN